MNAFLDRPRPASGFRVCTPVPVRPGRMVVPPGIRPLAPPGPGPLRPLMPAPAGPAPAPAAVKPPAPPPAAPGPKAETKDQKIQRLEDENRRLRDKIKELEAGKKAGEKR